MGYISNNFKQGMNTTEQVLFKEENLLSYPLQHCMKTPIPHTN